MSTQTPMVKGLMYQNTSVAPPAAAVVPLVVDWDAVYAEQLPRVYNFLRYRVGTQADIEDLTARTFEKAWSARSRYRSDLAGFATWLLSIAGNVAIDYLRATKTHMPLEAAEEIAGDASPEQEAALQVDCVRLGQLLAKLPERERELLALKYGGEATNRDIAKLTGLSESNVGTILHRVVQQLRAQWSR
ncbi:MAG: sigma-70 family RNA polymerase sigma factor [Steroidobacteraceae bacterium]